MNPNDRTTCFFSFFSLFYDHAVSRYFVSDKSSVSCLSCSLSLSLSLCLSLSLAHLCQLAGRPKLLYRFDQLVVANQCVEAPVRLAVQLAQDTPLGIDCEPLIEPGAGQRAGGRERQRERERETGGWRVSDWKGKRKGRWQNG